MNNESYLVMEITKDEFQEAVRILFDKPTRERIDKLIELYDNKFIEELSGRCKIKHNVSLADLIDVYEDTETLLYMISSIVKEWFKDDEDNYIKYTEYTSQYPTNQLRGIA